MSGLLSLTTFAPLAGVAVILEALGGGPPAAVFAPPRPTLLTGAGCPTAAARASAACII